MFKVLDTGKRSAKENMEIDQKLLDDLTSDSRPILHFYQWSEESATYGYFIKTERFLDLEKMKKWGISLAKRPTGGGIVFHSWDLAFSVLVPSSHPHFSQKPIENYCFINELVLQSVKNFFKIPELLPLNPLGDEDICSFCMAKPTIYDVMLKGKKIAGAAQRKKRQGFLHQGTISIAPPPEEILKEIVGAEVFKSMRENSCYILDAGWTRDQIEEARQILCTSLKEVFTVNYPL